MKRMRQKTLMAALTLAALIGYGVMKDAALAEAAPAPVIGAYYADRGVEPTRFSPLNVGEIAANGLVNNYVREISWSSWGEAEAVGSGQVSLVDGNNSNYDSQPASTSPVTVRLSGLKTCLGLPTYTSYSLTLTPSAPQPSHWPKGRAGRFPCLEPTHHPYTNHPLANCWQGLQAPHFHEPGFADLRNVPWRPKLPAPGLTVLCSDQIVNANGAVAKGTAIRENLTVNHALERNWPATFVLSRPIWCPTASQTGDTTNAYSRLSVKIYGPPRSRNDKKALSSWGHQGLPVTGEGGQEYRPSLADCQAGISQLNPIPAG